MYDNDEADARQVAAGQVDMIDDLVERINETRIGFHPPIHRSDIPGDAEELLSELQDHDLDIFELVNEMVLEVESDGTLLLCCGGPTCRLFLRPHDPLVEATAERSSYSGVWYVSDLRDEIAKQAGWAPDWEVHPIRQVEAWLEIVREHLKDSNQCNHCNQCVRWECGQKASHTPT